MGANSYFMKIQLLGFAVIIASISVVPTALNQTQAAETSSYLWQIGVSDNDDREFALAPNRYSEFREDGFYVIGASDAKRDWPYVHPGPVDSWAGSREHTFTVAFGLKSQPAEGTCRLRVGLVDTHSQSPPRLRRWR